MRPLTRHLLTALTAVVALAVLGALAISLWGRPAALIIGCKNFTESRLLAEIMAQAAERRAGIRVERCELGSTSLCWHALRIGAIGAYPEYTGTLLADILNRQPVVKPSAALAEVIEGLAGRQDLEVGRPFGLNDTYVLAMRADRAHQLQVSRISDLVRHPELVAGFTAEFNQRADGWTGLARRYAVHLDRPPLDLHPGHMYQAVRDGQVDIISAFSTDARLSQFGLVVLEDDRGFFPAYQALPLMRRASMKAYPGVVEAWADLEGRIDGATMTDLIRRIDLGGESLEKVAASFLDSIGLRPVPVRRGSGAASGL